MSKRSRRNDRFLWEKIQGELVGKNDAFFFSLLQRGIYSVSDDGRVFKHRDRKSGILKKPKEIKASPDHRFGYLRIKTRDEQGKHVSIVVGRLAWMAHNGRIIPDGCDIHHVDEDITNHAAENLEAKLPREHRANGTSFGMQAVGVGVGEDQEDF